jgi:hypothetical protein
MIMRGKSMEFSCYEAAQVSLSKAQMDKISHLLKYFMWLVGSRRDGNFIPSDGQSEEE